MPTNKYHQKHYVRNNAHGKFQFPCGDNFPLFLSFEHRIENLRTKFTYLLQCLHVDTETRIPRDLLQG